MSEHSVKRTNVMYTVKSLLRNKWWYELDQLERYAVIKTFQLQDIEKDSKEAFQFFLIIW